MDSVKSVEDTERDDQIKSEVGDLEDAGETTAADTITGPTDTKPVGTDTMLKVSGGPEQKE
jgi:hypothetical protein